MTMHSEYPLDIFPEEEEDIFFWQADDHTLFNAREAWSTARKFPWFIDFEHFGGVYLAEPSVWIISRGDYIRAVPRTGCYFFNTLIPAKSLAVALFLSEQICRHFGMRNLGVLSGEELTELIHKETHCG